MMGFTKGSLSFALLPATGMVLYFSWEHYTKICWFQRQPCGVGKSTWASDDLVLGGSKMIFTISQHCCCSSASPAATELTLYIVFPFAPRLSIICLCFLNDPFLSILSMHALCTAQLVLLFLTHSVFLSS